MALRAKKQRKNGYTIFENAIAYFIACGFYLFVGHNLWIKLLLVCFFLLGFKILFGPLVMVLSSLLSIRQIRRAYDADEPPRLFIPPITVSCINPVSKKTLMRLFYGLMRGVSDRAVSSSRKYRLFQEVESEIDNEFGVGRRSRPASKILGIMLRRIPSYLFPFSLIYDDMTLGKNRTFEDYLYDNAVLRLVAVPIDGLLLRRINSADRLLNAEERRDLRKMTRAFPRWMRKRLCERRRKLAESEREVLERLHTARGPIILILSVVPSFGFGAVEIEQDAACHGYLAAAHLKMDLNRLTAKVVETMANTALPIASSDARLDPELRKFIGRLARFGLAPLADCYLRLRLAYSDVERFLCLIDCFEVLIKYSVFSYDHFQFPKSFKNRRPSLGEWWKLLDSLVVANPWAAGLENSLRGQVSAFWANAVEDIPNKFIAIVREEGLLCEQPVPNTNVKFLEWLTALRNQTKGHGGLQESTFEHIWHPFHETFLFFAYRLAVLTVESHLFVYTPGGGRIPMRGWLRGDLRTSTLKVPTRYPLHVRSPASFYDGETEHSFGPFVHFVDNTCQTWNAGVREKDDFVDYSTGKISEILRSQEVGKSGSG